MGIYLKLLVLAGIIGWLVVGDRFAFGCSCLPPGQIEQELSLNEILDTDGKTAALNDVLTKSLAENCSVVYYAQALTFNCAGKALAMRKAP